MNRPEPRHEPRSELRKPRICVLTYKSLTRLLVDAELKYRKRADVVLDEVILDDAIAHGRALQAQGETDVLVSAGSNAVLLRAQLDIPVVSIEVTGFDLLQGLQRAREVSDRIGMVVFKETMPSLGSLKEMLSVNVIQHSYETLDEARLAFAALQRQGVEVVLGSSLIVDLAAQHGMQGVLVYTSNSIERALEEAIQIGETALRQAARYDNLNAAFAHLHEAILTVDPRHRITAINPLMQKALGLDDADAPRRLVGERLPDVATELSLAGILSGQEDEVDVVVRLVTGSYLMNRTAIVERGEITGALLTLRDTFAIQRADSTIRSQPRPKAVGARYSFDAIAGTSPSLLHARSVAERCARTSSTVLITGETGTGKELFAQAIHNASARSRGPFVALNCASFPESLLESELFGYDPGSFTGARKAGRLGLFEAAHTGTVFLDEIGDMPISLQTRLLRVLQEREIVRLGSNSPTAIDVRVIAATHRPLQEHIAKGSFRSDLFYRLNILHLRLPALRERADDIAVLALRLLQAKLRDSGRAVPAQAVLTPLLPHLQQHDWPGNIRELENLMERFAVFLQSQRNLAEVDYAQFLLEAPELAPGKAQALAALLTPRTAALPVRDDAPKRAGKRQRLTDAELLQALEQHPGNRDQIAESLGISRTTLWRRLAALDATRAGSA